MLHSIALPLVLLALGATAQQQQHQQFGIDLPFNLPSNWSLGGNGEISAAGSAFIRGSLEVAEQLLMQPGSTINVAADTLMRFLSSLQLLNNSSIIIGDGGMLAIGGGLTLPGGTARINGTVAVDNSTRIVVGRDAMLIFGGNGTFSGRIHLEQNATLMFDGNHTCAANASITGFGRVILLKSSVLNITNGIDMRIEPQLIVHGGAQIFITARANLTVWDGVCQAGSPDDITSDGVFSDAGFAISTQGALWVRRNFTLDGHYCSLARGDDSGALYLAPERVASVSDCDVSGSVFVVNSTGNVTFRGAMVVLGDLRVEARLNVSGSLSVGNLFVLGGAELWFDPQNLQIPTSIIANAAEFRANSKFVLALHEGEMDAALDIAGRLTFDGDLLVLRRGEAGQQVREIRFATFAQASGRFVRVYEYGSDDSGSMMWVVEYNAGSAILIFNPNATPRSTSRVMGGTTTAMRASTSRVSMGTPATEMDMQGSMMATGDDETDGETGTGTGTGDDTTDDETGTDTGSGAVISGTVDSTWLFNATWDVGAVNSATQMSALGAITLLVLLLGAMA